MEDDPSARHRREGRDRDDAWVLIPLALLIGAAAGLGAILLRLLIAAFTFLITGDPEYGAEGRVPSEHLPGLGPAFLLLVPVVGGLIYGPMLSRLAPHTLGVGIPDVMLAVARDDGRIATRPVLVRTLASALCIGSGGSLGVEGPVVVLGSALASSIGRVARVARRRLPLLVGCGAAAATAVIFDAPVAGALLGLELVLAQIGALPCVLLLIAALTGTAVRRALFGEGGEVTIPDFVPADVGWELVAVAACLGILGGLVGLGFAGSVYGARDIAHRIWPGPMWLLPATGGLLVGVVLLALPQLYGLGYPVIEHALGGEYAVALLLALAAGKILAASLTLGIGGAGGIFAPALYIGAMVGAACGAAVDQVLPTGGAPIATYGLIGMAVVLTGAARLPVTGIALVLEISGELALTLPLFVATTLAAATSLVGSRQTIYTRKLHRQGIDLTALQRARSNPRWLPWRFL